MEADLPQQTAPGSSIAGKIGAETGTFVRQSSGLVRVGSLLDVFLFNVGVFPIGPSLSVAIFWALAVWPGADLRLAVVTAVPLSICIWATYALLTAAMPRSAAQYVVVSRILHPSVGFMADACFTLSSWLSIGTWGYWFTTQAIAPSLANLGYLLHNTALTSAGQTLNGTGGIIVVGTIFALSLAIVMAVGMRFYFRIQKLCFVVGLLGLLPMVVVLLVHSPQDFQHAFNSFAASFTHSKDSYHAIITSAAKNGLALPSGHPFSATLPSTVVAMGIIVWVYWSASIAGEMRGARSARRQTIAMVGAGIVEALVLLLMIALVFHVFGYNFLSSIIYLNNSAPAHYPLTGVSPYVFFFVQLLINNLPLTILTVVSVIVWYWPPAFLSLVQPVRSMFAYAFDGLIPRRLADVNDRTHAPILAIVICTVVGLGALVWAANAASFFTITALIQEQAMAAVFIVGLTGLLFPYRRPELYRNSPADVRVAGIPLVSLMGLGCMIGAVFYIYVTLSNPAFGLSNPISGMLGTLIPWAIALLIFGVAWYARQRQGLNLARTYQQIPPE